MTNAVEAVLLCLDPAKHTSGAAILIPDYGNGMAGEDPHPFQGEYVLHEFGKVTTQSERERFVESMLGEAMDLSLPPVVVAEEWDPPRLRTLRLPGGATGLLLDPKWTYDTVLGIGEGWGLWNAELLSASAFLQEEHGLPALPIIRAKPNEWRDGVFPSPRPKNTTALKETARRVFEGVFGFAASDDIAEAGCIGLWATQEPRVAEAAAAWVAGKPQPKTKSQRKRERKKNRR